MGLKATFESGGFAVLAEMEPPKGVDVAEMVDNARRVKEKVDAFVVPEMSNAVMRMSSLGGAVVLQSRGMETVMQLNCRDRNRLALQADLLAGAACGVPNVMAVTGEDPSFGDHHQARAVYDIDLDGLLGAIGRLSEGRDLAGVDLEGAPRFLVGATVGAGARDRSPELEIEEMNRKAAAGARFFITPPVFDLASLSPFMKRVSRDDVRIIPTVVLLKSLGMARYMARNMPHVYIPDELIARIRGAGDKVRECLVIARELIGALKEGGFAGVYVATVGWERQLPAVLETI